MGRRLLVCLALLFAVAAGVALGAGPLSAAGPAVPTPPADRPVEAAEPARPDPRAAYADALAAAVSNRLYDGDELAGRGVALLRLPGVPDDQLGALVEEVGATGAGVVAQYAVEPALLDPAGRSLVDTLGSQLAEQLAEAALPGEATAYERIGALLGSIVATRERRGAAVSADASMVRESLASAGLVTPVLAGEQRSPIVLVVLGEDAGPAADPALHGLVTGLAAVARTVVVAAPGEAAAEGGGLSRLRAAGRPPQVTTVDGIDGAAGRVTAGLALIRSFFQGGGDFGASGADGPVPMR